MKKITTCLRSTQTSFTSHCRSSSWNITRMSTRHLLSVSSSPITCSSSPVTGSPTSCHSPYLTPDEVTVISDNLFNTNPPEDGIMEIDTLFDFENQTNFQRSLSNDSQTSSSSSCKSSHTMDGSGTASGSSLSSSLSASPLH